MARKKDMLREKRRKEIMRKRIIIGVIIGLAVIAAVAAFVLLRNGNGENGGMGTETDTAQTKETVATVDGNEITEAEFIVYFLRQISTFEQVGGADIWDMDFDGETPENVAKQNTLDYIAMVKECVRRAKESGFEATGMEMEQAKESAEAYVLTLPENIAMGYGITAEMMTEVMLDNTYFTLLFNEYTADYVPESPDYEDELSTLIENEVAHYESLAAEAGEEPLTDEEKGEITARVEEYYLTDKKSAYFQTIYETWAENVNIDVNSEVYDRITVAGLKS